MTKEIQLTQGKVALVDDEDYDSIRRYKWHCQHTVSGYKAARNINVLAGKQKTILMHRVIMDAPADKHIDHINHDSLDNRKSNLRLCTHAENVRNRVRYKNNTSGFKGVSWRNDYKKWHAYISLNKQVYSIGMFDDKLEAARAYDKFARKLFGEFALLNLQ